MAVMQTPNGLVVGLILPEEKPAETEKKPAGKPGRGSKS